MFNNVSVDLLNQSLVREDWPRFDFVSLVDAALQLDIHIRSDLSYLAGHFPEQPVVPGVVQIHWVAELARRVFECRGFVNLKKIKFSNVVLPESSLKLRIEHRSDASCHFEYHDAQQSYSSGVISFQSSELGGPDE